ncbi:MAG: FAD-dependent oxidoreductase [Butyrivibrio sp.]|nr:FAD-dependent oxidoreductase [Butyrivibrio sp.]
MIRINQIKIKHDDKISTDELYLGQTLTRTASKMLKISEKDIKSFQIIKHSIDARKKPEIYHIYTIDIKISGKAEAAIVKACRDKNISVVSEKAYDFWSHVGGEEGKRKDLEEKRIVVIGCGPAGLFCGYELARQGFRPVILERGADVDKRSEIVDKFWAGGELDEKTNVQFGEGGAGTFSDGKLNTMVKDKDCRGAEALDIFVSHGAPERIKYEAKPHIGTDILKSVVKNIREDIKSLGSEVYFETKVTELVIDEKGVLKGVKAEGPDGTEQEFPCDAAVLAIGHSARDTFYMLKDRQVEMQPKPFAVGFRVEHPQSLINLSQYGATEVKGLGAAPYKLVTTTESGRGVYSFCMCPGGYVVNASSEKGRLAVNGMSYSGRDGRNANSAIIITVDPSDFGGNDILSGVEFQRGLEEKAYNLAGGRIPAEYYIYFKKACGSAEKGPDKDYIDAESFSPQTKGEYEFAEVHKILPDELNKAFVEGMENFGRMIKGYNDSHALVLGVESRTSSPVRINRGDTGESTSIAGLFPCGEGAGYAGGIMSAAMDGIRSAEWVAEKLLK